jgi:hypothetical protein
VVIGGGILLVLVLPTVGTDIAVLIYIIIAASGMLTTEATARVELSAGTQKGNGHNTSS